MRKAPGYFFNKSNSISVIISATENLKLCFMELVVADQVLKTMLLYILHQVRNLQIYIFKKWWRRRDIFKIKVAISLLPVELGQI
jgi:hypothetical protein